MIDPIKAVALGGGHGLHATLTALRQVTNDLTAVVTVADDGGSSGRIRHELPVLPPGDLRMALAALAGEEPEHRYWAELLQHRLGGSGALAGHPIGNLLLTGMLDHRDERADSDPVAALDRLAALVGAVGRVLPMSPAPLDLIASADRFDPDDPERSRRIRGQVSIASASGRVRSIRLEPPGAPACAAAVDAIREADVVVLGPGSWFTSVIPHLLLRELGVALSRTRARVIVTLNLVPQPGETDAYDVVDLLRILCEHAYPVGGLSIDTVLADADAVGDEKELADYVATIGARLALAKLADDGNAATHDPGRYAEAIRDALARPRSAGGTGGTAWR